MNTIGISVVVLLLLMQHIHALRCRSGNQQMNNELRKVMQKCKSHHTGSDRTDDNSSSTSSDNSSEEDSSSDETIFENDFFTGSKKNRQNNGTQFMGGEEMNKNHRSEQNNRESTYRNYSSNSSNNSRMGLNRMANGNSNKRDMKQENRGMQDNQKNNDHSQRQACSIQCFFDELSLVDQRGYPERAAVTGIMMRGIQDPVLRDFVEESIMECFHYLSSMMNQDKCTFSQHLMACFADKGKERCEDWDD